MYSANTFIQFQVISESLYNNPSVINRLKNIFLRPNCMNLQKGWDDYYEVPTQTRHTLNNTQLLVTLPA